MIEKLLEEFRPGRRIYLPGATGESLALAAALRAEPGRMRGVHVVSCLIPGMNDTDYAGLAEDAFLTVFLGSPTLQSSVAAGRVRVLPLGYTGIACYLAGGEEFDVAIAQLAPPEPDGFCSLGIAADFTPLAWQRARRRVAIVNPEMPAMRRGPRLALAEADVVVTAQAPLICAGTQKPSEQLAAVARNVAALVPESAAIQLGIGGAPAAVWAHLAGHRDLLIASGMVADDLRLLAEAGALRRGAMHRTGVAHGSMAFYQYLADSDLVGFATVPQTHGLGALAALPKFTSINGALEVDLLGQVNAEWRDGRLVSGIGGALDFMRGAAASEGGRSIIALPALGKGGVSRIVAKLGSPGVSVPRSDVDSVVTEYGVAELRNRSMEERAQALIAIAPPAHRESLAAAWRMQRNDHS
jgi:acyl-CoA hydrolase